MNKRILNMLVLGTVLALVAVPLLTGCAKPTPTPKPVAQPTKPPEKPTEPPKEKVSIRFGMYTELAGPMSDLLEETFNEWNKANPDIQVTYELTPDYWIKIPAAVAAGTAPDILPCTNTETTSTFATHGMYLPLDDYIKDSSAINAEDFVDAIWETSTWRGTTWVIPYDFTLLGIVYNKAMFDAAGVAYPKSGWTWDDFLDTAKKLVADKDGDGNPDQFGFGLDSWPFTGVFPFILSNGVDLLAPDLSKVTYNTPKGIEAVQFYLDLVRKEHVAPTAIELGEVPNALAAGIVAMKLDRSWAPWSLSQIAPDMKIGVASLPQKERRVNYFEGMGFGINAKSEHPDEAWQVIEFLCSKAHQKELAEMQVMFPARKDVLAEVSWSEPLQAFLDEAEYGVTVMIAMQWECLTSNWVFWGGDAISGLGEVDVAASVVDIEAASNEEINKLEYR